MTMNYRQLTGVSTVVVGLLVLVFGYIQGNMAFALTFVAIQALAASVLLWFSRPRHGGAHLSHTAAQAAAGDDDIILYWQPG